MREDQEVNRKGFDGNRLDASAMQFSRRYSVLREIAGSLETP